jgi:hypothetical protein
MIKLSTPDLVEWHIREIDRILAEREITRRAMDATRARTELEERMNEDMELMLLQDRLLKKMARLKKKKTTTPQKKKTPALQVVSSDRKHAF